MLTRKQRYLSLKILKQIIVSILLILIPPVLCLKDLGLSAVYKLGKKFKKVLVI